MSFIFDNGVLATPNVDAPSSDAFNRLRVSSPETLFSDRGLVDNQLLWTTSTLVGGTVTTSRALYSSMIDLNTTTDAGSTVIRQTRQRIIYQPGKSQLFLLTFVMQPKTNVRQRVGYFGDNNGVYVENDGVDTSICIRSSSTNGTPSDAAKVTQANWNLDRMDGTGPSGLTLDMSKAQIFIADLEWLGVGRVRAGFVLNGTIIYVHEFNHANIITQTYMGHASLPLRYEIVNTGATASATTLASICQTVMSEGGQENAGLVFSQMGTTPVTLPTGTAFTPLMSARLAPTSLNGTFEMIKAEILNTASNNYVQYKLIINGTLTGASWVAGPGSLVQYDATATAITGGTDYDAGFITSGAQSNLSTFNDRWRGGFDINGVPDTITLAARRIGNATDTYALMTWKELY